MDVQDLTGMSNAYRVASETFVTAGAFKRDNRLVILMAFINIALDHHESIMLLIERELTGSGFALVRSLFEAVWRGHWVVSCATDEQVNKITEDKCAFPNMPVLVDQVDATLQTGGIFSTFKGEVWRAMNDFTHGGTKQLSKQLT